MFGSIFKNSSYLFGAQIVTKLVSFFYTLFLAKTLGVENFGFFTVALSYFSLFSSIAELGLNRYLTREVALMYREERGDKLGELLCIVTIFRLTSVAILFAIFTFILNLTDPDHLRVGLSILAISAVLPQAIAFTLDSTFVGVNKIFWSAIGLVVLNFSTITIGVWLVLRGYGTIGAVSALVFGEMIYALILFLIPLRHSLKFLRSKKFGISILTKETLQEVISGSLPYGILGVLGLIYFKIDAILLSYLRNSYEVGIYGVAYRFLEAIVFIPASVATASFPILANLHSSNISEVKKLYWKIFKLLFKLSILCLVLFIIVIPILIRAFLPQYSDSIAAILILSFTIPFMFIHIPGAVVLLSTDKYLKPVIYLSIFTVAFNILANFIFIPEFGYIGASFVTVVSCT